MGFGAYIRAPEFEGKEKHIPDLAVSENEVGTVVTVKVGKDKYMKHYLGRADNVFPFVEQLEAANVSDDYYRVIFKPQSIIPDIPTTCQHRTCCRKQPGVIASHTPDRCLSGCFCREGQ